jgi:HK97 gp10 family phage protein
MAATGIDIELLGGPELQRAFKLLEGKVQDKILKQAMKSAGDELLAEIVARTPVAGDERKNQKAYVPKGLNANVNPERLKKYSGGSVVAALVASLAVKVFQKSGAGFLGVTVGVTDKSVYYASFVELGTKHQKEQRFMRGALDENADRLIASVTSALQSKLDEIAKS